MSYFFERNFDQERTVPPEQYTEQQNKPDKYEGLTEEQKREKQKNEFIERKKEDLLTDMLTGMGSRGAGRGVQQQNVAKNQGFNLATDGSAIGRDPLVALPFDKHYAKTANFIAIVNNLNPDLYQRNEQVLQSMKQSAPEAVKALQYKPSLYEGVPQNFFVNRFNIALQRKRENDFYAFI